MFEGRLALNPGLNLTRVSLSCVQKHFSRIIFSVIFRALNHQLVDKKIKTEILLKLSNLNSNLALSLGYLNPALNNSAQVIKENVHSKTLTPISILIQIKYYLKSVPS